MFWNWTYTVHIMEKRPDGTVVWVFNKKTNNLKKAYRIACNAIDKIEYLPYSVMIYRSWREHTVPTASFEWGHYPSFDIVDFYL